MNKLIAAYLDENGKTASFKETGIVKIFTEKNKQWVVIREIPLTLDENQGMNFIRKTLKEMVEALGECKVVVAKEVVGIPYNVLDGAGFNVWEIDGVPEEFLDYVFEKEEEEKLSASIKSNDIEEIITEPVETVREGYYFIDFKEIQEKKPEITSKQVLIPFFREKVFYELEAIFSHIPKWLEAELQRLNFKMDVKKINDNEFNVIICKKVCGEN